jgi:hypothetical protein
VVTRSLDPTGIGRNPMGFAREVGDSLVVDQGS